MTQQITLPTLDFPLTATDASVWRVTDGGLSASAPGHTDLFIDPSGQTGIAAESLLNAETLLGEPGEGDFMFSARVGVDFRDTFDAGVLLLWFGEQHWGKLCFERSPAAEAMVVSVVTRGVSDDANSFIVDGDEVWLRVSRLGAMFAYHASTDGRHWHFVRAFRLEGDGPLQVGFEAQSPVGEGCDVRFSEISFTRARLADLRDGS